MLDNESIETAVHEYVTEFEEQLHKIGTIFLPYPQIAHQEVVERCLSRRRPFSKHVDGYRDFLIWTTLLELAKTRNKIIAFVSENISDFAEHDQLHPDLLNDLDKWKIPQHRVLYFRTLNELNDRKIRPTLDREETLCEQMNKRAFTDLDLWKWTESELEPVFVDNPQDVGLSPECHNVALVIVRQIMDVRAQEVRRLQASTIIVFGQATVQGDFVFRMDKDTYLRLRKKTDYVVNDEDPDDPNVLWLSTIRPVSIDFSIVFDEAKRQIVSSGKGPIFMNP